MRESLLFRDYLPARTSQGRPKSSCISFLTSTPYFIRQPVARRTSAISPAAVFRPVVHSPSVCHRQSLWSKPCHLRLNPMCVNQTPPRIEVLFGPRSEPLNECDSSRRSSAHLWTEVAYPDAVERVQHLRQVCPLRCGKCGNTAYRQTSRRVTCGKNRGTAIAQKNYEFRQCQCPTGRKSVRLTSHSVTTAFVARPPIFVPDMHSHRTKLLYWIPTGSPRNRTTIPSTLRLNGLRSRNVSQESRVVERLARNFSQIVLPRGCLYAKFQRTLSSATLEQFHRMNRAITRNQYSACSLQESEATFRGLLPR